MAKKLKSDFLKQSKNFFEKWKNNITINFKELLDFNYSKFSNFKLTYRNNIKLIFEKFKKIYNELNFEKLNDNIKEINKMLRSKVKLEEDKKVLQILLNIISEKEFKKSLKLLDVESYEKMLNVIDKTYEFVKDDEKKVITISDKDKKKIETLKKQTKEIVKNFLIIIEDKNVQKILKRLQKALGKDILGHRFTKISELIDKLYSFLIKQHDKEQLQKSLIFEKIKSNLSKNDDGNKSEDGGKNENDNVDLNQGRYTIVDNVFDDNEDDGNYSLKRSNTMTPENKNTYEELMERLKNNNNNWKNVSSYIQKLKGLKNDENIRQTRKYELKNIKKISEILNNLPFYFNPETSELELQVEY